MRAPTSWLGQVSGSAYEEQAGAGPKNELEEVSRVRSLRGYAALAKEIDAKPSDPVATDKSDFEQELRSGSSILKLGGVNNIESDYRFNLNDLTGTRAGDLLTIFSPIDSTMDRWSHGRLASTRWLKTGSPIVAASLTSKSIVIGAKPIEGAPVMLGPKDNRKLITPTRAYATIIERGAYVSSRGVPNRPLTGILPFNGQGADVANSVSEPFRHVELYCGSLLATARR
ncbi:hypothetical protein V493_00281 [Pseudogymnoascus sp. VKM F-4281 (FW-2241)]|nr:hypothetical protein V493_00281 [Pseudogymnoascus sp. VKM F-4281 (FW-2241)]